jgi:hypothetical protein
VLLVCLFALGAVSLVCVRADGAAAPQFVCKVSVEHPGDDKDKVVLSLDSKQRADRRDACAGPGDGLGGASRAAVRRHARAQHPH